MKQNVSKRLLALVLSVLMVVGVVPAMTLFTAGEASYPVLIVAGSDFQDPANTGSSPNYVPQTSRITNIMNGIKATYGSTPVKYAFFAGGDYMFDSDTSYGGGTKTKNSITNIQNTVKTVLGNDTACTFVQGNHDATSTSAGYATFGAHDADEYGVFVINEDNYQSKPGSSSATSATATALDTYLSAKANAGYTKPVFVLSHVPLHYTVRTTADADATYAYMLYNVLAKYGDQLNIIFLFGHDHAWSDDDYLGGSSVFMGPDTDYDEMYIAGNLTQNSDGAYLPASGASLNTIKSSCTSVPLNFVYMNFGYVGYYWSSYNDRSFANTGADNTLTMTSYLVYEDHVEIARWAENANGTVKATSHVLKYKAGTNPGKRGYTDTFLPTGYVNANQTTIASPATFNLKGVTPVVPAEPTYETFTDTATGVTVSAWVYEDGALSVTTKSNAATYEGIASYNLYDITVSEFVSGSTAVVSLPVPAGWTENDRISAYWVNGNVLTEMEITIASGMATFSTTHFSEYMLAYAAAEEPDDPTIPDDTLYDWQEIQGEELYTYTLDTDGVNSGSEYLIVGGGDANAMISAGNGQAVTINGNVITLSTDTYDWKITSDTTYTYTANNTQGGNNTDNSYTLQNPGNYYVQVGQNYYQVTSATRTKTTTQTSYTSAGTTRCSTVMGSNSNSWTKTNYYYKVGDNYYPLYAKRSGSSGSRTYTWGYSTTDNANNVTQIGTQNRVSNTANINITIYTRQEGSTSYTWTIRYNGGTVTQREQAASLFTRTTNSGYTVMQGNQYLNFAGTGTGNVNCSLTNNKYLWKIDNKNSGNYAVHNSVSNTEHYLRYNSGWLFGTATGNVVRLYRYTGITHTPSTYVRGVIPADQSFSTTRFANQTELENYLKTLISVYTAADTTGEGTPTSDYTLSHTGTVNPAAAGSTTYTVSYEGITLGSFDVTFTPRTVTGISIKDDNEGSVFKKSSENARTSSYIYVNYDEGEPDVIEITADMLSGEFDLNTLGDYENLTVSYKIGNTTYTATGYTLHVIARPEPAYPQGGSVKVGKSGEGINFAETGVARIELTASGIPANKGVDLILMLDTSSSMDSNNVTGTTSRMMVMRDSLKRMIDSMSYNEDGTTTDIRVAIADFNGYTQINSNDKLTSSVQSASNVAQIYTGPNPGQTSQKNNINASAFVQISTLDSTAGDNMINSITGHSGTNYDYAFDTIYRLGSAIKEQNANAGVERDLYVVFMTDGASFQYNYYMVQSGFNNENTTGTYNAGEDWNQWLKGTYNENGSYYNNSTHKYFYNPGFAADGVTNIQKHWMAEAIKGDPDANYTVISPNNTLPNSTAAGQDYMYTVPGLGATMYSIGYCLYDDKAAGKRDEATSGALTGAMTHNITHLASLDENGEYLYRAADTAADLDGVFGEIAGAVAEAATNAYFVDTMGADYDIQLASFVQNSKGDTINLNNGNPLQFTVSSYDLYKASEVGTTVDGVTVTLDMVGTRKPGASHKTNLETLTFSADGTSATSDKKTGECIVGDLIVAKTFIYNMSATETVTLDNGYQLPPETFYWTIGTLSNNEVALSYYVYLTGALEGTRDAGTYPTNESAVLHYVNWVGDDAEKETITPRFSWKAASVSYAFYLVDENGNVIDAYGNPTGFANRQQVGTITYYDDVLLNQDGLSLTVEGVAVLPDGYIIYDPAAAYSVYPASSQEFCRWEITNTSKKTTYVTRYRGADFTNEEKVAGGTRSGYVTHSDYAFTDTVVWFALVYTPKAQDDVVVIDFGLPVDISVLANDLPLTGTTVAGLGTTFRQDKNTPTYGDTALDSRWNSKTLTLAHGIVTIVGSKVRYTPTDMQMSAPESFSYALSYTEQLDGGSVTKYLYANVTVVPATIIYYETDFNLNAFTFTGDCEGTVTATLPTQAEDRPGPAGSFGNVDADNLYGFDSVYMTARLYSASNYYTLTGSKPTGSGDNLVFPTSVSFTFTGTGFDVISRTGADDGAVRATIVNTETGDKYYVNVINKGDIDSLAQIPVISYNGLPYGTYTVTIGVYGAMTSIGVGDQFIFDAVRIFDPAKESEDSGTSYLTQRGANYFYALDKEENPTFVEPRNLMIDAEALTTGSGDAAGIAFVDKATYPDSEPPQTDDTEVTDHVVYAVTDYYTSETLGHGPNDEVYLAAAQAIAFSVDLTGVTGLHMGAKTIGYASLTATAGLKVTVKVNGKAYITENRTITSPTDLKFDIFEGVEIGNAETAIVVVENTGAGVLSITDLKVIHGTPAEEPVASANPFFVNAATATFATAIMEDVKGDVNFDGVVTIQDTTEMLRSMSESTMPYGIDRVYDVNGDGVISIRDVTMLLGIISGN